MNILVTGCNGQLGTEIRLLSTQYPEHHYFFTDVAELDITDEVAIHTFVEREQVDCIINCAAYTAVDKAEDNVVMARRLNAEAPGLLAQAVAARGGVMIHISTDYVFDGSSCKPYTEDVSPCPQSVYGQTKLEGERAVLAACPQSVILRTAWLYSPWGNNFVKTMLRLGQERSSLGVVFDQIGTPTFARDLAKVIFSIIDQQIVPGIYHFTDEGVTSWYDFTLAIHHLADITSCQVHPLHTADYPTPARRPHYSVLDKTKLKETYHVSIPHWMDSLQECIEALEKA